MSHTATIDIEVKDAQVVMKAAERLGWKAEHGTHRMYDGTQCEGIKVELPGWQHPIIINPDEEWEETLEDGTVVARKGKLYSDNYNGHWGDQKYLDEFRQIYGVEKAEFEAGQAGLNWSEDIVLHPETGAEEIQVTINVPGEGGIGGYDGGLNTGGGLSVD